MRRRLDGVELVLLRLVFVEARRELSQILLSLRNLALDACRRALGARKLFPHLPQGVALAHVALRRDLPLELHQALPGSSDLRVLGKVARREVALELPQLFAQRRRTLLEVGERWIVPRSHGIAGRRRIGERTQLLFDLGDILVGVAQ